MKNQEKVFKRISNSTKCVSKPLHKYGGLRIFTYVSKNRYEDKQPNKDFFPAKSMAE